jgi:ABC-type tungstate transport system substrate-binding protein
MTSDTLTIAAIDLLPHPDAALLNILEVTFQVAFWATLAALVFALRVAAAVRTAATLSGGEARRGHIACVRALGRRVGARHLARE